MITVILSEYKRPQYLASQIEAFNNQTVPCNIWIDYTVPEGEEVLDLASMYPNVKVTTRTNQNLYHIGRFFYGLNSQDEYVFICDDDIIPGKNYLYKCIQTIKEQGDCIITGYGLKFDRKFPGYHAVENWSWHKIPEGGFNEIKKVDMAGHSWFMKRSSLSNITREIPYSYQNGEDLFFSYITNKYTKISIIVLPHILESPDNWSCDYNKGWKMGNDDNATWRLNNHLPIRHKTITHYLNNGWKLINDSLEDDE